MREVATGFVGGSYGVAESTLEGILRQMAQLGRPRPEMAALKQIHFMLLGFAYNVIDRTVYAHVLPPRRKQLMDEYVKWLRLAITELLPADTPSRVAVGEQLTEGVYDYHQLLGGYEIASSSRPLKGTLLWELGKLVATKLGAEMDPVAVTVVSVETATMARVLMDHVRTQVPRIRW